MMTKAQKAAADAALVRHVVAESKAEDRAANVARLGVLVAAEKLALAAAEDRVRASLARAHEAGRESDRDLDAWLHRGQQLKADVARHEDRLEFLRAAIEVAQSAKGGAA